MMTSPKNPRSPALPLTLSTAEALANQARADQLIQDRGRKSGRLKFGALEPAGPLPFERTAGGPAVNAQGRREQALRESYLVSDTTPSTVDLSSSDVPGYMQLEVTAIDAYDHNPRLWKNEKFDEIYNSIKENGFTGSLTVTRRRAGERYMLAAGSNTTLEILQDLWARTGDEKYRWVNCIFQPYERETRLLAQHLGENLNRGDMRFWEIAKGVCSLLDDLEAEAQEQTPGAKPMSIRDKVEALSKSGIKAQRTTVQLWAFASERLGALGAATAKLTGTMVHDAIQPRFNALRALAEKFGVTEVDYWPSVVDPVLERYAKALESSPDEELDALALCDLAESEFAVQVNESLAAVRQMLSLLKLSPALTLADLRMPSPNLVARANAGSGAAEQEAAQAGAGGNADTAAGAAAELPPAAGTQPPLPLGPGQVRGAGAKPPAAPAGHSSRAPAPPAADPAGPAAPAPAEHAAPAAQAPLFAPADADGDPLKALHAAVEDLLATAGLGDTVRFHEDMPLGFYIELPDRERHARQRVQIGSPEHYARMAKSLVWWSLVYMTGQLREGAVPFMDQGSLFFKHFSSDDGPDPLDGTDVENQHPDPHELQIHRILPGGMREATRKLRIVEELAAIALERLPERLRRLHQVYSSQSSQSSHS